MAQTKNPRRVSTTEARAKLVNVRISPQKLNLVAQSIRGLPVQKALNELEFSRKRIATDVRKVLYSAVSNAENNHNLDIDNMIVAEAFVLGGQDPGDEAFREPRSWSFVAYPETVQRDHHRGP